jgi:hypothetical protein
MATRKLLRVVKETVYATPAAVVAADTIWAEDVRFMPRGTRVVGNPARPSVGSVPGQVTGVHGEMSFNVPLITGGSAGNAARWDKLATAAGFSRVAISGTSVTYILPHDPAAATASLTLDYFEGLRRHRLYGARGKAGLKLTAGQRPMLNFMYRGLLTPLAAAPAFSHADADFAGWGEPEPIAASNTTAQYGAAPIVLRDLSVDQNDNVQFLDLPGRNNVRLSGERVWTGSLKVDTPPPGVLNFEQLWKSNAQTPLQVNFGGVAGRIVTVNARCQISGEPTYGEEEGQDVTTIPVSLVASAVDLDDELSIILT